MPCSALSRPAALGAPASWAAVRRREHRGQVIAHHGPELVPAARRALGVPVLTPEDLTDELLREPADLGQGAADQFDDPVAGPRLRGRTRGGARGDFGGAASPSHGACLGP